MVNKPREGQFVSRVRDREIMSALSFWRAPHLPGHRTRTRWCMVGRLEKRFGGIDRNPAHRAIDQGGHKRAAVNQVICFLTADKFANS